MAKRTPARPTRKIITAFTLTPTNLSQIDEMTDNGNRSEFIRRLIESEYQKRQEQK